MNASQRKARANVRRCGVDCEIALTRADRAESADSRARFLADAQHLAELALTIAPSAVPARCA